MLRCRWFVSYRGCSGWLSFYNAEMQQIRGAVNCLVSLGWLVQSSYKTHRIQSIADYPKVSGTVVFRVSVSAAEGRIFSSGVSSSTVSVTGASASSVETSVLMFPVASMLVAAGMFSSDSFFRVSDTSSGAFPTSVIMEIRFSLGGELTVQMRIREFR